MGVFSRFIVVHIRSQCLEANLFLIKFQIVAQELLIFKKIENIVFVIYIYLIPFKNLRCSKKSDINLPTNNFKFFPKVIFGISALSAVPSIQLFQQHIKLYQFKPFYLFHKCEMYS
jgi:hypothetical protein